MRPLIESRRTPIAGAIPATSPSSRELRLCPEMGMAPLTRLNAIMKAPGRMRIDRSPRKVHKEMIAPAYKRSRFAKKGKTYKYLPIQEPTHRNPGQKGSVSTAMGHRPAPRQRIPLIL